MMRISSVLLFFFLINFAAAQNSFFKTFGATGADCASSLTVDSSGDITLAGKTDSFAKHEDGFVLKLNGQDQVRLSKRITGTRDFDVADIQSTFLQHTNVVVGSTKTKKGDLDGVIALFNPAGAVAWKRTFGGTRDDLFKSVTVVFDGGFAVVGETQTSQTNRDFLLVKFTPAGGVEWKKTFGTPGDDFASHIAHTSDGGFIISGTSHAGAPDSAGRGIIVKIDTTGNIQWSKTFRPLSQFNVAEFVTQAFDPGYFVVQYVSNTKGTKAKTVVTKVDLNGDVLFSKSFRSGPVLNGGLAALGGDGGLILGGSIRNRTGAKGILIKLDSNGNVVWKKVLNATGHSTQISKPIEDLDHGFLAAGCFGALPKESPDIALLKVKSDGTIEGSCNSFSNLRLSASAATTVTEIVVLTTTNPVYRVGNPKVHLSNAPFQSTDICQ